MTKLFLSFTTLVRGLIHGGISELDLATGLFYVGCARQHAFTPWKAGADNELTWFTDDADLRAEVHEHLIAVLEAAEADGRVAWRAPETSNSFDELNRLIVANGFPPIDAAKGSGYSYPGAQDRIDERNLDIECVF